MKSDRTRIRSLLHRWFRRFNWNILQRLLIGWILSLFLFAGSAAHAQVSPELPTFSQLHVFHNSSLSVTITASVSSNYGVYSEKGIVYSRTADNADPVIGGTGVTQLSDPMPTFLDILETANGLTPQTQYSYRAYAINGAGIGYSALLTFTTTANSRPALTLKGASGFVATGSMTTARYGHTATLLNNGKVLVVGGVGSGTKLASAEIYDPQTATWSPAGNIATARSDHTATLLPNGKVIVVGGNGNNGSYLASCEVYDPATGAWAATGNLTTTRVGHTATLLNSGKILITGGVVPPVVIIPPNTGTTNTLSSAEIYDPATGAWTATGSMSTPRTQHAAVLMGDGKVYVTGGASGGTILASTEMFDPVTGVWTLMNPLRAARSGHTATLGQNSDYVVVVGGTGTTSAISATMDYYLTSVGNWEGVYPMLFAHNSHTTTLLANGALLTIGGGTATEVLPGSYTQSTSTESLSVPRASHAATSLADGNVLVVGGFSSFSSSALRTAEIYRSVAVGPEGSTVSQNGTLTDLEGNATVTLTASIGNVTQDTTVGTWSWTGNSIDGPAATLVTLTATDSLGGVTTSPFYIKASNVAPSVSISAPSTATAGTQVAFTFAATDASSVDQAAGFRWTLNYGDGTNLVTTATGIASPALRNHTFPNSGVFTVTASATDKDGGISAVATHVITILGPPSLSAVTVSNVTSTNASLSANIISDGSYPLINRGFLFVPYATSQNPVLGNPGVVQVFAPNPTVGAFSVAVTGLTPATDYVVKAFATNSQGTAFSANTGFITGANHLPNLHVDGAGAEFSTTGDTAEARIQPTATTLADGRVLLVGGYGDSSSPLAVSQLYNPNTGIWGAGGTLTYERVNHAATLLPNGKVLVTGGVNTEFRMEIFNPATGIWGVGANSLFPHFDHTATVLGNGDVLVVGPSNQAELYHPTLGTWTATGVLTVNRSGHTATLLPSGKVLVVGGDNIGSGLTAELYDPLTGTWSATGIPSTQPGSHTATLLPTGKVLMVGDTTIAELYDPGIGSWNQAANLPTVRMKHTATMLGNGRLLIAGGAAYDGGPPALDAMIYDPGSDSWKGTGPLPAARNSHVATRLNNGKVLLIGGVGDSGYVNTCGLYDPTLVSLVGTESGTLTQSGTFSDVEGNATVVLSASVGTVSQNSAAGTWAWNSAGSDGPAPTEVTITATDASGGTASTQFLLSLVNTPPSIFISAPTNAKVGSSVNCYFFATDPSLADQTAGYQWSIDYGDGGPPVNVPAGSASPLSQAHKYLAQGTYTITVSATDKDGGVSATASHPIIVGTSSNLELWRYAYFGTDQNAGNAANMAVPQQDGITNLMKFATGLDPTEPASQPGTFLLNAGHLEFFYNRNVAAMAEVVCVVEWADSLSGPWTNSGVNETLDSASSTQLHVRAVIPAAPPGTGHRFARLRVSSL